MSEHRVTTPLCLPALHLVNTNGDPSNSIDITTGIGPNCLWNSTIEGLAFPGIMSWLPLKPPNLTSQRPMEFPTATPICVQGAITNNTFTLASSRNSSITGIFRTVCSGSISNNKGLPSAQIANQQPVG